MRLSHPLLLTACLLAAGCGGLRRSPAWEAVISSRIDTRDSADPSATYAEQLSAKLKAAHVEHKVVTYEFRYRTRLREEAMDTRTAVLYRDDNSSRDPWWLADDRTAYRPVWLPRENLDYQLAFYLHRQATVVSVHNYHAPGDGKKFMVEPKIAQASKIQRLPKPERPSMIARLAPMRKTERSRPFVAPAKPTRDSDTHARQLALFRQRHGSNFDPASVADRVKMERLLRKHRAIAKR